jgi:hypothetical protein
MRPWCISAVALGAGLLGLAGAHGSVWGAFSAPAGSSGNEVRSAPDFIAPTAAASVIQKTEGGATGYIRQGGTYRVHANVTDSGNPASGLASVTGNLSTLTAAQPAAVLTAGTFSAGGQSYNYRSAGLTATTTLAAGTYAYALTSSDAAANSRTQPGLSVIVDNTAPSASDVQTANTTAGTAGKPEAGDTVTLTYSEPVDANSVLSGWGGAATNVVVRIDNNVPMNDRVAIYNATNATQLPLGTIDLGRNDYVSANATFGASGTPSTMIQSVNAIIITLGTASSGATTAGKSASIIWSPSATATDRAGNAESTATRTETGSGDKDF